MKTLLLLAGRSKRFWPLAEKSFFPICGKPLIAHQVERLRAAGCTDITLVAGAHNLELAKELFPDLPCVEQKDLDQGMQGAMVDALPGFGSEPVLIVSGNDVVELSAYKAVREKIEKGNADGALLAKKVEKYFPGGYLTVDGDRIVTIVEKPKPGEEPSDMVNVVVHAHRDASVLLKTLQGIKSDRDDGYEQAIDKLCKDKNYEAVSYNGPWHAVKYPWHVLSLLPVLFADMKPSVHPTAKVHPSAVVEGNVIIDEGARILPFASVMGPCYIGKHAIVGNGALVRDSSVGDHCVVGFSSEVKSSVLASHVWMHMAYAGDSVIGNNVSFGAYSVTGNLRLDEGEIESMHKEERIPTGRTKFGNIIGNDVRLGIHVGLNPGVKVGEGSFISSGVLVTTDVPDTQFVSIKDGQMHLRPNRTRVSSPADREVFRKGIQ